MYEPRIHETLALNLNALKEQQKKIQQQINITETFLNNNMIYQKNREIQSFEYQSFPTRYLYTYTIDVNIYDLSSMEYESYLRQFKQSLATHHLPNLQFSHVGTIVKQTDLLQDNLYSNTFFVFCSADLKHLPNVVTLKSSEFTIDYGQSFDEEKKMFHTFKDKVNTSHRQINGDYLCEVVREMPHASELERNMFIRTQIPVSQ